MAVGELHDPLAAASVLEAAEVVIGLLSGHGRAAVYGHASASDVHHLAGDASLDAGGGTRMRVPTTDLELEVVAPDAPPSGVQLAVRLLTATAEREVSVATQRRYEQQARAAAGRFATLVAAAPDAILVVGRDGRITAINPQAEQLFGYAPDELVGLHVDELLPEALRDAHQALRESYAEDARPRPMGAGRDLEARRADGTHVAVDIGLTPIGVGDEAAVAAFVRDATPRRRAEADRRRLLEGRLRQRQALELNDTVVQGLVALLWRLEEEDAREARRIAEATLTAARRIMADLLRGEPDDLGADHLVRSAHAGPGAAPADTAPGARIPTPPGGERRGGRSVVIADDAADLRYLLRRKLDRAGGVQVIAEAADGQEAVDLALRHRPDAILLDLSMPVLDGLEAARRIRAAQPGIHIVVLSGYPDEVMKRRALEAGADRYCEKTASLDEVYEAVAGLASPR